MGSELRFIFILSGVLMALAQKRYFDAVAARDASVRSTEDAGKDIAQSPRRLFRVSFDQTLLYLRLLVDRQEDPLLERWRVVALLMTVVSIAAFIALVAT